MKKAQQDLHEGLSKKNWGKPAKGISDRTVLLTGLGHLNQSTRERVDGGRETGGRGEETQRVVKRRAKSCQEQLTRGTTRRLFE